MMKTVFKISLCIFCLIIMTGFSCTDGEKSYKSGLIGIYFSEPNLTSIKAIIPLKSLEQKWDDNTDFISGSSGEWNGFIRAPVTANVIFRMETNRQLILKIGAKKKIEANQQQSVKDFSFSMQKNELYPVQITFLNPEQAQGYGYFKILWQTSGQNFVSIPSTVLFHGKEHVDELAWLKDPDLAEIDFSQFLTVDARHVIVYYQAGRFAGWPANAGIWSWGDEILVGFAQAYHKENKYHHSIDRSMPMKSAMARSLDGGETWVIENQNKSGLSRNEESHLTKSINFSNPDLAIKLSGNGYYTSSDRGRLWHGPFAYEGLKMEGITTRTDYMVNGKKDCFFFLSVKDKSVSATLQDRSFCAQTLDGGKSFKFLSWMAETDSIRSVMSSTVRFSKNHLVTALRRRYDSFNRQKKQ